MAPHSHPAIIEARYYKHNATDPDGNTAITANVAIGTICLFGSAHFL